jgi:hypothetical protein
MPEVTCYQSGFTNVDVTKLMAKLYNSHALPPVQAAYFKPKPDEELYDLRNDPWELNNLASSPEHKQLLATMRAKLEKWFVETDDRGRVPESQEDLEKYHEYMKRKIKRREKR